jgi:hypothetical protein
MNETQTVMPARQPRSRNPKRRRWLLICLALLVPLGFTVLAYLITQRSGVQSLADELAESDRLDPNWRMADIEAHRRPYPKPENNGINQIMASRQAMPPTAWPEWPFPQAGKDNGKLAGLRQRMDVSLEHDRFAPTLLNAEEERVLRAEVARARAAIELARQLTNYSHGRFPVKWTNDFVSTMLPHVQNVRETATLLKFDGLLRAHDQDLPGALEDVRAILHASRAIGDEQTFISQLVRIACDSVAVMMLERSLACGVAQEGDLAKLQKELEAEAQTPFFMAGFRGERAAIDWMLESVQKGDINYLRFRDILRMMGPFAGFFGGKGFANSPALDFNALRMYLNIRGERARHLHYLNEIARATELPTWEALDVIEAKEKAQAANPTFGLGLVTSCFRLYAADLRAKATLRTACTAVASERYRLANGKWPEKLSDLVPRYLAEVPLDPFDGAPLRLVRKGSSLFVYSVSQDKQDQGGAFVPNGNPMAPGSDIGFVLHDPARRRLPGKPFEFPETPGDGDP